MKFDLEDRTAIFGEKIIELVRKHKGDFWARAIFDQILRSGTSIGANYCEANEASSKKDFLNKIAISKKETNETKYWLRMISKSFPEEKNSCRELWKEAHELILILSKILINAKK